MDLTPQQVNTICKGDPEIAHFFNLLLEENRRLREVVDTQAKQIRVLEKRVHELERQLHQNSHNSSKPPSSDGLRKRNNSRQPGGKKGAPKGHDGHTLCQVAEPDETIIHPLVTCGYCESSLAAVRAQSYDKRQVMDLPPPRMVVTEHRAERKCCPHCRRSQTAAFPRGVEAPAQYGDGFTAWTAYLNQYQLLPLERISQLFGDLTGYRPSEGTLLTHVKRMTQAVRPMVDRIRQYVMHSPVVHADETGIRVAGKVHWIHTASTDQWTFLGAHESRGSKGMNALGVLPQFKGYLVHDCYASYFKDTYDFRHVLCNAHLLRDCQGIADYDKHQWAAQMKQLLQKSWRTARQARKAKRELAEQEIRELEQQYDDILERGRAEWMQDAVPEKTGPRGRKSKSKAANLGQRFIDHKEAILGFLRDASLPFDNNQAERDIRMVKVKAKVSGGFRTREGLEQFTFIRSFISTLRKQHRPILASLSAALRSSFCF